MNKKARLSREEADLVARNIESQGGDASELREAMTKTDPIRKITPPIPGLVEQTEGTKTPVAAFWSVYHSLPSPTPLSAEGQALKSKVVSFAKSHGLQISPSRDLDRFAEALSQMPECPWGKDECICYDVQEGGPCKAGLLVK